MNHKFLKFSVVTVICIQFVVTGCKVEQTAFKAAQKENTVESYESYLLKYPNGKKSEVALERLNILQFKLLDPDWIVFVKGKFIDANGYLVKDNSIPNENNRRCGTWYGRSDHYLRDFERGTVDWIAPVPAEQTIILIILNNEGMPKKLQKNKAYFWKGGKDFVFIKDIDGKLSEEELKKQFGMKHFSFGLEKPVSF